MMELFFLKEKFGYEKFLQTFLFRIKESLIIDFLKNTKIIITFRN